MRADPKPPARIKNSDAIRKKLAEDQFCRACGRLASEGHHILYRSGGGDDVPENILPLCMTCHRAHHDGATLTVTFVWDELHYLSGKMGFDQAIDYLERRYGPRRGEGNAP